MQNLGKKHRKIVYVCTNVREVASHVKPDGSRGGECCGLKGSIELHKKLKEEMKKVDLTVRVSKCGCMDRCSEGPTVAIMPDDVWIGGAAEADIPQIIEMIR